MTEYVEHIYLTDPEFDTLVNALDILQNLQEEVHSLKENDLFEEACNVIRFVLDEAEEKEQ